MRFRIPKNNIYKYIILIILIFYIIQIIPKEQLQNQKFINNIILLVIGFIIFDYLFIKNNSIENFAWGISPPKISIPTITPPKISVPTISPPKISIPPAPTTTPAPATTPTLTTTLTSAPAPAPNTEYTSQIERIKQEQQDLKNKETRIIQEQQELQKQELRIKQEQDELYKYGTKVKEEQQQVIRQEERNKTMLRQNNSIADRYYNSLVKELITFGIISNNDIENIKIKLDTKLLTLNEVITSLEKLKETGKPKTMQSITDDHIYDELPKEFFEPIGKGVEKWTNDYVLLNTDKWRVPMPNPPVCVNTTPCNVCPSEPSNLTFLKSWNNNRIISPTQINKKWINNQVVA